MTQPPSLGCLSIGFHRKAPRPIGAKERSFRAYLFFGRAQAHQPSVVSVLPHTGRRSILSRGVSIHTDPPTAVASCRAAGFAGGGRSPE